MPRRIEDIHSFKDKGSTNTSKTQGYFLESIYFTDQEYKK